MAKPLNFFREETHEIFHKQLKVLVRAKITHFSSELIYQGTYDLLKYK